MKIVLEQCLIDVVDIYKEATKCNSCFEKKEFKMARGKVRKAQPRWIGKDYFSADLKICVMLINPGNVGPKGTQVKIKASRDFDSVIKKFGKGTASWNDVMSFIVKDMKNWDEGRYWHFYFKLMKLPINQVAMMNMMLCSATKVNQNQNYYTTDSLRNCYVRHTKKLITKLDPDFLILSGTKVTTALKLFRQDLLNTLPNCEIIDFYHCSPRIKDDRPRIDKEAKRLGEYLLSYYC